MPAPVAAAEKDAAHSSTPKPESSRQHSWSPTTREAWLLTNAITCLVWGLLVALAAVFYGGSSGAAAATLLSNSPQHMPQGVNSDWSFKVWKFELHDLGGEPEALFRSYLCPGITWADSVSTAGLLGFWAALLLFLGCTALDWLLLTWGAAWAFRGVLVQFSAPLVLLALGGVSLAASRWGSAAALAVAYRRRLRWQFQMDDQDEGSFTTDCLAHFCCGSFAINQEARHVQAARRAGHSAVMFQPSPAHD
jgi:Cys-rich protein (TIGR01571 family)